jgi:hypothetical protein
MPKKHVMKQPATNEPVPSMPAVADRRVNRSSTFFTTYTNDVQLFVSPWDVRLILGELGDQEDVEGKPVLNITQLGEVRMSAQIAKRLVILLSAQLKTYETLFGLIPSPPD